MFLGYFGDDFPREISGSRDVLSLREETLLEERLYLYVIFHLIELKELLLNDASFPWLCGEYIYGILLHLHEEDLRERLTVDCETVLEVIYGDLHARLDLLELNYLLVAEEPELVLVALQDVD